MDKKPVDEFRKEKVVKEMQAPGECKYFTHSDNYRWAASGSQTMDLRGSGTGAVRRQNGTAVVVLEEITLWIKSKFLLFTQLFSGLERNLTFKNSKRDSGNNLMASQIAARSL